MKKPNICARCILPETFPGLKLDDKGVCNHCRRTNKAPERIFEKKEEYSERFDHIIAEIRGKAPAYDVIMAYSGGKDSSYTLKLLKEQYDLRILAFTFDNHFVSPMAFDNISTVCDALRIDSVLYRMPWDVSRRLFSLTAKEDIFSKATLLRASSICTACIGIVKSLVLKTALEMSIPMVAFGWSPGQAPIQSAILKTNAAMMRQNQSAFIRAFPAGFDSEIKRYVIPDVYFEIYKERFPKNIHPLAFFDYNEENIATDLNSIGWKKPEDTDTNSSNCLLNAYANQCHIRRHGYHPYVWEIANMVRQGIIERTDGINKIYTDQNPVMVKYAKERLDG